MKPLVRIFRPQQKLVAIAETPNDFVLRFHLAYKYNQFVIWRDEKALMSFGNEREGRAALKKLAKDPNWR